MDYEQVLTSLYKNSQKLTFSDAASLEPTPGFQSQANLPRGFISGLCFDYKDGIIFEGKAKKVGGQAKVFPNRKGFMFVSFQYSPDDWSERKDRLALIDQAIDSIIDHRTLQVYGLESHVELNKMSPSLRVAMESSSAKIPIDRRASC